MPPKPPSKPSSLLLSVSMDRTVAAWDLESMGCLWNLPSLGGFVCVAAAPPRPASHFRAGWAQSQRSPIPYPGYPRTDAAFPATPCSPTASYVVSCAKRQGFVRAPVPALSCGSSAQPNLACLRGVEHRACLRASRPVLGAPLCVRDACRYAMRFAPSNPRKLVRRPRWAWRGAGTEAGGAQSRTTEGEEEAYGALHAFARPWAWATNRSASGTWPRRGGRPVQTKHTLARPGL